MNKTLPAILVLAISFSLGCGGPADDTSNSQNTNSSVPPIAEIVDANHAMAHGDQLFENNRTEEAIDAYFRATELDPDLADAWFKLGIAYALIEKEQALAADPDSNRGDEAERPNSVKAFRKAIDAYKKMLDVNPDDDVALYNIGRAYNKINEDKEAAKALRQAVELKPDNVEYQIELGAILIKLAQYREAIPPLKKALELDPENARAADLLEDAEAGRTRIDYVPPKKDDSNKTSSTVRGNANVNTTANVNTSSNTVIKKPTPVVKPTAKPE